MNDAKIDEEAIFDLARKIDSPEARDEYLAQACGEDEELRRRVLGLLDIDQGKDSLLDRPAFDKEQIGTPTAEHGQVTEKPGDEIANYKLLQKIGEGGFGVVYMAEQTQPVRRKVALKVIKPGMDSKEVIARFEAERQALAVLDDPSIAKMLDAGTTESGRPFFVMELVHGVPITEFCNKNKSSIRHRIELYQQVCQAIQHAHLRGIIHRDIKPSNVLITLHDGKPVPKVIDFGVAKALNQQLTEKTLFTAYGQVVGTPQYMSPEQAEMSGLGVDTRSDIYSLGVLLYELLTGAPPVDQQRLLSSGYAEMIRIIREEEPPRPSKRVSTLGESATIVAQKRSTESSQLIRELHGDLDWIVMKMLEKERDRRYESIRTLSNDLDRYLQEQPVAARPPSIAYRTSKYVRRNRVLIGTASLLIGIMAVATAVSVSARRTAIRERNTANDEREIADQERHRASQNLKLAQQSEAQALVAERTTAQALEKSKRFQYAAEMVQASYALAEGDISRMHELLERQPHELRKFEHDYLRHAGRKRDEVVCNTEDKILNLLPSSVNDQILVTYNQGLAIYTSDWEIVKKYESDYVKTAYDGERLAYTKSLTELAFAVAGQPPQEKTWSCQHRIACLDFSPTSSELAILAEDGLRVLNPDTMDEKRITSDVQPVWVNDRSIAFSPNGKWLAASDGRGTVRVWDTETYELQHEFRGGLSLPLSWNFGALQFSNDSMLLAVAFAERILVFNFNTSKERELGLPAYINDITAISLSHNNGNMIAVCNADGTITVIDSRTGAVLDRLIGHEQRVRAVQFRENGALLSAGVDRTIRKWQDVGDIAKDVYTTTVDFKFLQELGFLPHGGITFLRRSTQDEHYPWRSTVAIRHPDGTVTATPIHSWRHWFAVSGT